jgi:hypothetical protein
MFAFLYNTFYIRPAFIQNSKNPASAYPDIHHALMTQRVWIAPRRTEIFAQEAPDAGVAPDRLRDHLLHFEYPH